MIGLIDAQQVTHLALESTGVFWRPFYNLLEDGHTVILVNPHHMKAVPGKKTDVKDCEWIADLLRHGLLEPSFIPAKPFRDMRDLMRYRKSLVYMRVQEINHLGKVQMNVTTDQQLGSQWCIAQSGQPISCPLLNATALKRREPGMKPTRGNMVIVPDSQQSKH